MVGSVFFFQAEDGIRDLYVTGVQTCALPISCSSPWGRKTRSRGSSATSASSSTSGTCRKSTRRRWARRTRAYSSDRKSTRLNSSHVEISYAVFCLKKKKKNDKYSNRGQDQS